jgi:GTP-binding protein
LFLIPADSKDIAKEYRTLLNELEKYNPELLDKRRILAISKSDMLDKELSNEIDADIKKRIRGVQYIFISSVTGTNMLELKDLIWKNLNE